MSSSSDFNFPMKFFLLCESDKHFSVSFFCCCSTLAGISMSFSLISDLVRFFCDSISVFTIIFPGAFKSLTLPEGFILFSNLISLPAFNSGFGFGATLATGNSDCCFLDDFLMIGWDDVGRFFLMYFRLILVAIAGKIAANAVVLFVVNSFSFSIEITTEALCSSLIIISVCFTAFGSNNEFISLTVILVSLSDGSILSNSSLFGFSNEYSTSKPVFRISFCGFIALGGDSSFWTILAFLTFDSFGSFGVLIFFCPFLGSTLSVVLDCTGFFFLHDSTDLFSADVFSDSSPGFFFLTYFLLTGVEAADDAGAIGVLFISICLSIIESFCFFTYFFFGVADASDGKSFLFSSKFKMLLVLDWTFFPAVDSVAFSKFDFSFFNFDSLGFDSFLDFAAISSDFCSFSFSCWLATVAISNDGAFFDLIFASIDLIFFSCVSLFSLTSAFVFTISCRWVLWLFDDIVLCGVTQILVLVFTISQMDVLTSFGIVSSQELIADADLAILTPRFFSSLEIFIVVLQSFPLATFLIILTALGLTHFFWLSVLLSTLVFTLFASFLLALALDFVVLPSTAPFAVVSLSMAILDVTVLTSLTTTTGFSFDLSDNNFSTLSTNLFLLFAFDLISSLLLLVLWSFIRFNLLFPLDLSWSMVFVLASFVFSCLPLLSLIFPPTTATTTATPLPPPPTSPIPISPTLFDFFIVFDTDVDDVAVIVVPVDAFDLTAPIFSDTKTFGVVVVVVDVNGIVVAGVEATGVKLFIELVFFLLTTNNPVDDNCCCCCCFRSFLLSTIEFNLINFLSRFLFKLLLLLLLLLFVGCCCWWCSCCCWCNLLPVDGFVVGVFFAHII